MRERGTFSLRALHVLLNVGGPEQGEPFSAAVLKSLERRLFAEYDADRSGGLDRAELERLLRDLYQVALVEAEQQDASVAWVARARSQLDSEYGQATVRAAVEQLLALRDANANGSLELSEIQAVLRTEMQASAFHRGRFWRLAPLCDVPIDMDRLTNGPNIKGKIFLAGAVSGIIAKSGCSPLSRITILLQTGGIAGSSSTLGLARHIFKSEGLRGFFRGNSADILRQVPYAGSQFLAFEMLKLKLRAAGVSAVLGDTGAKMLAGGVAGGLSIVSTYPLDLVRARLAVQVPGQERYRGAVHAMRTIAGEEGGAALFRGCGTAVAGAPARSHATALAGFYTFALLCVRTLPEHGDQFRLLRRAQGPLLARRLLRPRD